jgi:hypothetical protein
VEPESPNIGAADEAARNDWVRERAALRNNPNNLYRVGHGVLVVKQRFTYPVRTKYSVRSETGLIRTAKAAQLGIWTALGR